MSDPIQQPAALTPASVRQTLSLLAGIEITEEEAAAVVPLIEMNRRALAQLDRFDVREVRPASLFDPA
jgi:hypothetical protein